ncbi:RNA polymerase II transcription elongation factor-domain-containing protein [Dipodascopsis uninucleata]
MLNISKQKEYPVTIGQGFTAATESEDRALDQVYALKYNFKPDSIDDTKPSILTREGNEFVLESTDMRGDAHYFTGSHTDAKDVECMLIYDEATDSFELRHIGCIIRLKPSRSSLGSQGGLQNNTSNSVGESQESISSSKVLSSAPKQSNSRVNKNELVIELPSIVDEVATSNASNNKHSIERVVSPSEPNRDSTGKMRVTPVPIISDEEESDEDEEIITPVISRQHNKKPQAIVSDESSSDEDEPINVAQTSLSARSVSRPISLRGYAGGRRADEEDLSSSSEEE